MDIKEFLGKGSALPGIQGGTPTARAAEHRFRITRWLWAIRKPPTPSVYVRMPLVDDPGTSLLVWTTTPWTLPGNVAVAVHPDIDYVQVERKFTNGDLNGTEKADPGQGTGAGGFQG